MNWKINTHNIMVGNSLISNVWVTVGKWEPSTRPTLIDVALRYWATWPQTGSILLQSAHHGVYI